MRKSLAIKPSKERELPVPLTEEELAAYRDVLAEAAIAEQELLDTKAEISKDYNEQIKAERVVIADKASCIKSRSQQRWVECEEHHDFKTFVVSIVRMDSGEIISTRPMSEGERQTPIPFEDSTTG